jgi:hypothetical protein
MQAPLYSSRATELGRGRKVNKFTDAPDYTPAPNAYTLKTDFINQSKIDKEKKASTTQHLEAQITLKSEDG